MILRSPPWTKRLLSDAELAEIRAAEPTYLRVTLQREDNWNDGWRSALWDEDSQKVAEGREAASPIEAFRAACERIEVLPVPKEFVRWRDTDVEVA